MLAMLTVVATISALAGENLWGAHPSVVTVTSDGFTLTAKLPTGWSVEDGQILPPMALRSACRVRVELHKDRDWNRALSAALDAENVVRSATEHRTLLKVSGRVAVTSEYTDGSHKRIENVYIDLEDLEAGDLAVWTFEGDNTAEGQQCQMAFGMFIGSATIKLQPDAGH
jgi:hypothetical protein